MHQYLGTYLRNKSINLGYIKKEKAYREKANENTPSISSYTKEEYERFLEGFFLLAHKNAKPATGMAFLNADWRDFESTPAAKEKPDKSITIFDYHRLLSKTGDFGLCPLSSDFRPPTSALRLLISDLRHLSFTPCPLNV